MKSTTTKLVGLAALMIALGGFVLSGVALSGGDHCASEAKAAKTAKASAAGCEAHKSASLASSSSGCTAAKSAAYASNCERLEACSIDLSMEKATASQIEYYNKEKAQDGVALSGVKLPAFYATSLEGKKVSSKDLVGQPTVLVLLATHCGHSYQSLPILNEAAELYGPKGVRVIGLVVGSSPEKASGWFEEETPKAEVWVTSDLTVADKLKSHLVPTYVLVDAKGNVKTKLVGFKKDEEVKEKVPVLLVQGGTQTSKKG